MITLDLETWVYKVKFDTCKRFTGHDFLKVAFTYQSLRINNKTISILEKDDLKPLLHPIVRARMSWLQRKIVYLQGTPKLHLRFYNRISKSHRPRSENWHAQFSACTQYGYKRIHISRVTYEILAHLHFPW